MEYRERYCRIGLGLLPAAVLTLLVHPVHAATPETKITTPRYNISLFDDTLQRADLVFIGNVVNRFSDRTLLPDAPESSAYFYTVRASRVLKGDIEPGETMILWRKGPVPHLDPQIPRLFGTKKIAETVYAAMATPIKAYDPDAPVPEGLSIHDQVLWLQLAWAKTAEKDKAGALVSRIARVYKKGFQSPDHDLLNMILDLQAQRPDIQKNTIWARIRLGDATALSEEIERCRKLGRSFDTDFTGLDSDDAVTTLNLILEGTRYPWMANSRRAAATQLRHIAHTSSLPYLIKALDDPNPRIRYHSYGAIEKISGKTGIAKVGEFMNTGGIPRNGPFSPKGEKLIDQMKQWWEREGKRQFDYVSPKEK